MFDDSTESYESSNHVIEIKNGEMARGQLDKDALGGKTMGFLQRIRNDFSSMECSNFIDNLQGVITEYMKTTGFSVGISDLIADKKTNDEIEDIIIKKKQEVSNMIDQIHLGIFENKTGKTNEEHFETQVNNILNEALNTAGNAGIKSLGSNNRFVSIVVSGSKGNNLNISQMISCLGQQTVDGKRIPYGYSNRTLPHFKQFDDTPRARGFVENSFIGGLTPEELFFHAMGGRVGLIDTAVKTSQTGYIQRRLIKGMEDLKVAYDNTVRNNKNKIIQFSYGNTNFDTIHIENVEFKLLSSSIDEIYEYFTYDFKKYKNHLELIYEKSKISQMKKEKKFLIERTRDEIKTFLDSREEYIEHVLNFTDDKSVVYVPINFPIIINNVKNQCLIGANSLSDMTPIEAYRIIDVMYQRLELMFSPCRIFKLVYYWYMNPKNIIHQHKFNQKSLELLCEKIIYMYKRATINPGEMVGLVSAQSIGEPTTQMTLNTFHYAGVSSKSNVTRGVPRIEEILTLTKKLKNPSLTVYLKDEDQEDKDKACNMISKIEHTCLSDIVKTMEIYYDPNDKDTNVTYDEEIMKSFQEFRELLDDCYSADDEEENDNDDENSMYNKWILYIVLDETEMLDLNVSAEDVFIAFKSEYNDDISCYYTDFNDDNNDVVFRIRLKNTNKKKVPFNEEDQIYTVKMFQKKIMEDLIIRGVKNIGKVNIRTIKDYYVYDEDTARYDQKEICVLDTIGSNLTEILAMDDDINVNKTFSNDINEMYNVLGIEAARKCLFNEIIDVMDFDGTYINHHHISLLSDRMCCNEKMVSIFRHGINKDNIGPIAKASFEETTEMFLQAARHGELDEMRGVSANVMCGQEGYYGTSSFNVVLDINKMIKIQKEVRKEDSEERREELEMKKSFYDDDDGMDVDKCSVANLKIMDNLENTVNNVSHIEEENDYELDI